MSFEPGKCFTPNPNNSNIMFTIGGKYTSRNGVEWTCIARNRDFAWLRNITSPSGTAYVWKSNGESFSLNSDYDIKPERVVETVKLDGFTHNREWFFREYDAPKTWAEMSDAEKGALLLAYHEKQQIQYFDSDHSEWVRAFPPVWSEQTTYRIKPGPIVETVKRSVHGKEFMGYVAIDLRDGKPDWSTIRKWGASND